MRAKEVDIIRVFVLVALVMYHSLAPYTGGWASISNGTSLIDSIYKWVGYFSYAGMLETFTAISGFVFCLVEVRRPTNIQILLLKKIRRLYIPALIWGIAYYLLFINTPKITGIWSILNGIGHLWYLPMLLCCFILEKAFILKYNIPLWLIAIIAFLPIPSLPLHFNSALYYLLFFHCGYSLYQHKGTFFKRLKFKKLIPILIVSAILLILSKKWQENVDLTTIPILIKAVYISLFILIRIAYSIPIVALYFFVGYKLRDTRYYNTFSFISECSFGVYILQEFLIRIFYYKIGHADFIQPFFPLMGFGIGFVISLIIVWISKKLNISSALF